MPRKKKAPLVKQSNAYPPEVVRALKWLADDMDMSTNETNKLMVERGLAVELGRRAGYKPYWRTPDGREVPWPDDRPTKKLPFVDGDWAKALESLNGAENEDT
jgi:hypothetical protein